MWNDLTVCLHESKWVGVGIIKDVVEGKSVANVGQIGVSNEEWKMCYDISSIRYLVLLIDESLMLHYSWVQL